MKDLFDYTEEEYTKLQETGLLWDIFPDAPINVHAFKAQKEAIQLHRDVYGFLLAFSEATGADPADIWELFEQYSAEIYEAVKDTDSVDIEMVLKMLESEDD